MKKMLIMAAIAGSLYACNKQDITDPNVTTGENTVTLTITQASDSKGVSDQKGDTQYAVIGSGRLFFINSSNVSIFQRELTTVEVNALANTEATPGGNTVTITGVPSTAVMLYFIANVKTPDGTSYPEADGTTSADARLRIDKLQANVINVPMSGLSAAFTAGANNSFNAAVTLTPIVARVELGQITVQNQNGAGQPAITADITGYKLSGVYINNTRQDILLSGAPYLVGAPMDIRNQAGWSSSWSTYFNAPNTDFPYFLGGSPSSPANWVANALVTHCTPTSSGVSFYPDGTNGSTATDPSAMPKKAWGYQICPSTAAQAGVAADVPHIILKLTDITYSNNPIGETTKYITVTKYKDDGGNPISEFIRGNVYRIKNLIFTHNQVTNQPYELNITVTATITVSPWVINNISPDWN